MRNSLTVTAALACVLSLAACGGGSAGSSPGETQFKADTNATLTFMDSAPNSSLDPASVANDSSFSQAALYAIYDRLLGFDNKGNVVPQLATKWEYAKGDLSTIDLTLREGVTFQDGTVFDAQAVKSNLERSKSLGAQDAGKTVRGAAAEIAAVEVPDAVHVMIKLKSPDGGFLYDLASQLGMMISPKSLDGSSGVNLKPIGAGPFSVTDFQPTNTTSMARYDKYWDGTKGRPAKLVVKYVIDSNTRLNAVRSGQATVALATPSQVGTAKSSGLDTIVNPTASRWTIYLNTSNKLKDPRVRQALMYAVDRKSIAKALTFDTGKPTVQLIPDGTPGHVDGAESMYPYDPAKAKSLLADAGFTNGLSLDYILLKSPEYSQLTDVLKQEFAAVGVKLNVTTIDISQAGVFTSGTQGDMLLARWGGRADQLSTLDIVVGPKGTYAPAGAVSKTLANDLAKAATFAVGAPDRSTAIMAANTEAIKQAATIPIITRANIYTFKKGCISGLDEYLASGSNDWRAVTVGQGC